MQTRNTWISGKKVFFCLLLMPVCLIALQLSAGAKMPSIDDVPPSQWQKLADKKIFFGHQSVGKNMMKGIDDVLAGNPEIKLHVLRTREEKDFHQPIFAHASIGKNNSPLSKMDDFVQLMESGIGEQVNIAFLKFCFVDVERKTDPEALFAEYQERFNMLQKKYPDTVFVHLTVPLLRRNKTGLFISIKKMLKKMTGKKTDGFFDDSHNITRNEYNDMLTAYYDGKAPVFDIARLESTRPDGTMAGFSANGRMNYVLVPEYTEDGGHLNENGRRFIAEQLLIFLSGL